MRISDWSSDVCSSDLGLIETAKSFIHRWRRPKSGGAPGERFEPGRVCALAVGAQAHGPALGGRHDAAAWRGARPADAGEAARPTDSHLEGLIEWPALAPLDRKSGGAGQGVAERVDCRG